MSNPRLDGRRTLVTGGSEGIGRAIAAAFLAEGARVVIAARRAALLREAAEALGCESVVMDLRDPQQVEMAVAATVDLLGGLDVLVNNAAMTSPSEPVETTPLDDLQALLDTNLRGSFWAMRCAHPHLKASGGNVLIVSSMAGVQGQARHAAYAMTKGGLNALTKSAAIDWAPDGIRVNALCPAGTWTPALRRWCAEQPDPGGIEDYLDRIHALGYCPEADEIAPVAVFLCSDDARFVTGHIQHVSGGSECGYRL
ncbi:MAG: SDR family oxidoreductase [Planctomycetes bacterium]|nr:SDR family oxidoreductase [Planctomycetota bacterium]